jgi:hypothetical protein
MQQGLALAMIAFKLSRVSTPNDYVAKLLRQEISKSSCIVYRFIFFPVAADITTLFIFPMNERHKSLAGLSSNAHLC